jgi:hypothetical protein
MNAARGSRSAQIPMLDPEQAEMQISEQSKRIEFYITEYSVELLAQKMRSGEFSVPAYQREFVWDHNRKSRFIESLLMGLPIPFIFFWEMPSGKLEIVDGSQRLRTLEEFLLGDLRLGQLEQLTYVSEFQFGDLPVSRQRKIRNRSIRGIVLNEHADEAARFDMFERINTGSMIAQPAELRRGALAGPFMDLVIELSVDPYFVSLTPMSRATIDKRGREELVARFFAYGDGLDDYHDRPADFIFQYSKKMNEQFSADPNLVDDYRQRFLVTMGFVGRVFPLGFKKTAGSKATPRARFESIAIGSYLATKAKPELLATPADDLKIADWIDSKPFTDVTASDSANVILKLRNRLHFVRDKLADAA